MIELKNINDFEKVINNPKVIVDFFATWCGPCKMLAPMLEKVETKNSDVTLVKVDIDKFRELAVQFAIEAVPTLIFFKAGKLITRSTGFIPDSEIQKILNKI